MHVHVHVYTSMHARLAAHDIVHNRLLMLWKELNTRTQAHDMYNNYLFLSSDLIIW